jgi:hypothetical protein
MWLGAALRFCRLVGLLIVVGVTVATSNALANAPLPSPWRVHSTIDVRGLLGLSCPSVGLCVAVDGAGDVIESSNPGGGASVWQDANVDDAQQLFGISCPSASLCVAVDGSGDVVTSTNPAGGADAWTVARVDGTNRMSSVSCPSSRLCVVVDDAGNVVVSIDPAGGPAAWTVSHIDNQAYYECSKYQTFPCQPQLVGVSCPSVSLCVATDDAGFAIGSTEPTTDGSWSTGGPWSVGYPAGAGHYSEASCASESLCVGTCPLFVGLGGSPGCVEASDNGFVYPESVLTWNPSTGASQRYASISPNAMAGVWCQSGPLCFASDTKGNLFGSIKPAGGASAWSIAHVGTGVVTGLSCPSIPSCFAVDTSGNLLAGGPPPTVQQIRALLLEHLAPAGKRATIAKVLHNGGYSWVFTAPSAGQISISWNRVPGRGHLASKLKPVKIAAAAMRFANGGSVTIKVKLTRRGRRLLAAAQHLMLTAKATFTPASRPGITALTTFTLRR